MKRGATGFIGLLGEMPIDRCELYVPYDGFLKKTPAAWVGREHAAAVRSAAANGEPLHYTNTGEGRTVDSHNVVGILPGRTDEFILITCHHDAPHASAVEDASGLAALLALAKAFAESAEPLERGLIFLASSGHFHGGIGCREFVAKHRGSLLEKIVAAIGVEHIAEEVQGGNDGRYAKTGQAETRALFVDKTPELLRVLEEEVQRVNLSRTLAVDAYLFGPEPPCDSAPFFTAGIPSVCHISGPLYLFDPHDTIDMVRQEDLPKVTELFYRVIRRIDTIPSVDLAKGTTRQRNDPPADPSPWFLPRSFFWGTELLANQDRNTFHSRSQNCGKSNGMDEIHLVPLRLITTSITLIDEALTHIGFPVDHIAWALTSIDHPCEHIGNPVPSITLALEPNALPIM